MVTVYPMALALLAPVGRSLGAANVIAPQAPATSAAHGGGADHLRHSPTHVGPPFVVHAIVTTIARNGTIPAGTAVSHIVDNYVDIVHTGAVQDGIRMVMRGGTSKGLFLADDLPEHAASRDDLLLRSAGSPTSGRSTAWVAPTR